MTCMKKGQQGGREIPLLAFYDSIREVFRTSRRVVISAPTGAGKSTFLPLWLAKWLPEWGEEGGVLVAEPRRAAARSLARFVAAQWPTRVGEEVGYMVRFDYQADRGTRLTYLTDGILLRCLEQDPMLSDVAAVIIDEFQERRIDTDVALGMLLRAAERRPELRIVILSATLDGRRVAEFIGGVFLDLGASQIRETPDGERVFNGLYPVEVRYLPQATPAEAVRRALAEVEGDVLVFLPGKPEIERTRREIGEIPGVVIHSLHGEMDDHAQDLALAPDPQGRRKVILATNIAETSLTIEGVAAVVDSGWEKVSRFHPPGYYALEMERISRASATQRAGRAGRLGPGVVYRLWSRSEHSALPESRQPEILREDPMDVVLRLAAWGIRIEDLPLMDRPDPERIRTARLALEDLGLLDEEGRATPLGREAARLPLNARLARMVLEARALGQGLDLVLRAVAAASVRGLLVRLEDPQEAERAARARRPLEEQAAQMGSDLFLGALALDRPDRELREMGFRIRAVEEAREIWKQIRALLRAAREPDPDPRAACQAIAAGLADRLAHEWGRWYRVLARPEGYVAFMGRESLVGQGNAPLVAPWEPRQVQGRRGPFVVLTGCTRVDPEVWLRVAPARARVARRTVYRDAETVRVIEEIFDAKGERIFYRRVDPLPEEIRQAMGPESPSPANS